MAEEKKEKKAGDFYVNAHGGVHGDDAVTPIGRASFVYLTKPNTKFDPPKYSLSLLFKKDDAQAVEQLRKIQAMCKEMAIQLWEGEKNIPAQLPQPIFRDGDKEKYEGYKGHWYIVCKNEARNGFVIMDDVLPESIEAGMLVRCTVQPYVDKKNGFAYKLRALRFIKDDGVRFKVAPDGTVLLAALNDAVEAVNAPKAGAQAGGSLEQAFDASNSPASSSGGLNVL